MLQVHCGTSVFLLCGSIFAATTSVASSRETWIEKMECGAIHYQIESHCERSNESDTLNNCESQQLTTTKHGISHVADLPQLRQSSQDGIRQSGRSIREFFVTQWICSRLANKRVAVLYYSVGGGTGQYVDVTNVYDEHGKLIEDENNMIFQEIGAGGKRMNPVRSIMPD